MCFEKKLSKKTSLILSASFLGSLRECYVDFFHDMKLSFIKSVELGSQQSDCVDSSLLRSHWDCSLLFAKEIHFSASENFKAVVMRNYVASRKVTKFETDDSRTRTL